MAVAVALATVPAAARAEIVPSISPVVSDATGLTGMVSSHASQIARDANSLAADTALSAHATARHTLRYTDATVGNTVVFAVRTVRNVVVTVYGILDPVGQITGGRNAASVSSPATGEIAVSWQTGRTGCSGVALSNGVMLPVQRIAPNSIQVLRRNTRAGAGAGRISVNVLC